MKKLTYDGNDGQKHEIPLGKPYKIGPMHSHHGMNGLTAGLVCGLCFGTILIILRFIVG